jgi:glycosyltransferase involved in cell wall biosynthesis
MRFTIVVPTRERCETLRVTLKTLTSSNHSNLSILVSDNASVDNTRAVVDATGDSRVRYVNTGKRVSMARNWEFALSHVEDSPDNFVFYCGDDDAILPQALEDITNILNDTGVRAVVWRKADYNWPSWPKPHQRDLLLIPVENSLIEHTARETLRDVTWMWLPYYRCPALYNSFVDASILHAIRRRNGQFFHSSIPDAYSGFAVLSLIDRYVYSTRPFSINGGSGHSNGAAFDLGLASGAALRARFMEEQDIPEHPLMKPLFGSTVLPVMEALFQANDHVFDGRLTLSRSLVLRGFFREVQGRDPETWRASVGGMGDFAHKQSDTELKRIIAVMKRLYPNKPMATSRKRMEFGVTEGQLLVLDSERLGITDVEGAANYVAKVLGPYQRPAIQPYRTRDKILARVGTWVSSRVPDGTL